jgi:mono/diheme cytochrome c family protein
MAKKLFFTTFLTGIAMLVGACSPAWTLPSAAQQSATQQPTFSPPIASTIPVQPNSQNQSVPQSGNGYVAPQTIPNGGGNQQGSGNQPAPESGNNYGSMPGSMWAQPNSQNQSGYYGRGSGMRGGWNDYDNCMGGYGYNNGYASGQTLGNGIPQVTSQDVSFRNDVQPIFNARCVSCHGGTDGIYLDNYPNVMSGSFGWPIIVPGVPENSRLIQLVSSGYMPYGGPPLTQDQVQKLVNWVAVGAPNN